MPMNLSYVLSAYGVWIIAFIIYIPMLKYKLKRTTQTLETYQQKKQK